MPLIVICGQPASGKSTAAAQLCALLQDHPVVLIDEASLHLDRNNAYKSAHSLHTACPAPVSTSSATDTPRTCCAGLLCSQRG
jgi:tRNA uridine 5-carbamoylmethylation protein Kti12